ncbi:hypothetical protein GW781_13990, partial [bacterium]|nr:hypothetical protein [bacterium]
MPATAKKLGKLSLAIVEDFVAKHLGDKFIEELRSDTDKAEAIRKALANTEERFFAEFQDRRLYKAMFFKESGKADDVPRQLKKAVGEFYNHPTAPNFPAALTTILQTKYPEFEPERIRRGVAYFITVLTEELAQIDEDFDRKVQAVSNLRSAQTQERMANLLEEMKGLLEKQSQPAQPAQAEAHRAIHQLPPPPADFIQRPKELDELRAGFKDGRAAAISGLTGMGGIGKTVLGLVIAHELAKDYPDAQIFLDLKGTTAPLAPAEAMRRVIHSFEPAADLRALDEAQLAALYQNFLAGKKALLFWDNARSAEQVKLLLPPPSCAALITSRWQFPLPGLKSVRLGVMKDNEAKAFLLELCARIGASAPELARRCGCLPLALRIAGSFLEVNRNWSLPEYLERLQARRLQTLRSADDAELDLETVFDESYQSLREEERQKWRALAVFPASFDRPA